MNYKNFNVKVEEDNPKKPGENIVRTIEISKIYDVADFKYAKDLEEEKGKELQINEDLKIA